MICAIGFAIIFGELVGIRTIRLIINCAIILAIVALIIYIIVGLKFISGIRRKASQ